MGIFSSIQSGLSKFGNYLGGLLGGGGSSQSASAVMSVAPTQSQAPNQTLIPNISTPQGQGQTQPNGNITLLTKTGQPTGSVIPPSGAGYTPVPYTPPLTLTARSSGNTISPGPVPSTAMSSESLSSPSSLAASSSPTSVTVPSATSVVSTNPGPVNNAGLASVMANTHTYDSTTNTFNPVQVTTDAATEEKRRQTTMEKLLGAMPKKDSILESPEVVQQRAEVNRQRQIVNDYTSQLNSIVAKQNADLLQLRQTGSKEGVTEAVYGGQEAQVNREAAIRALPIQAALSASQGNLQLAQDFLTQVTAIKTEDVNNDYSYRKSYFDSVAEFIKGEDKNRLEDLKTKNEHMYQERLNNVKTLDEWARLAITNKQPQLIPHISSIDPSSPTFARDLATVTRSLQSSSNGGATLEERQSSALAQFSQAFTPGRKLANGTPTVDSSGQITPEAWKAAIADAPAEGLTREAFIKAFGNMILGGKGDAISDKYGLTPKEKEFILTQ